MSEEWRIISDHPDYEVSNLGNVRSLDRYRKNRISDHVFHKGRVLKQTMESNGYLIVHFWNPKKKKTQKIWVHRLVAQAFVPNPYGCNEVNHINNNQADNRADNLEWVTHKENMEWSQRQGRMNYTPERYKNLMISFKTQIVPVVGTDLCTGKSICYESLNSVKRDGFRPGDVCRCCKGQRHSHGGYEWRYANESEKDALIEVWIRKYETGN